MAAGRAPSSPLPHSGGKLAAMNKIEAATPALRAGEGTSQGASQGASRGGPAGRADSAGVEPCPSILRRLAAGVLILGLAGVAGVLAGFLSFTSQIAGREVAPSRTADAIVVLTGGASRIADAVELLAEGRGQRLLISGVNPALSPADLRRMMAEHDVFAECCIDLGHKALNTRGNAIEAAEWSRSQRFRSLLVVTSAWHMPRALVELGRALPEVELMAYPVVTTRMQADEWWRDPSTLKLLFKEYVKYMMAVAKIRPAPAVAVVVEPRAHPAAEARIAP